MNLYEEKEKLVENKVQYDAMDLFTLASFVESADSDVSREDAWNALLRLFKVTRIEQFTKMVQFF